jgi:predicted transcriptional regulator
MDLTNFFSVLSNPKRLAILELLNDESLKAAQISKKLDSSIQALVPHTSLLLENKIISKSNDDFFTLSSLGQILVEQIKFFEFCAKNHTFFKNHDFGDVPSHLMNRLGSLAEFEFVDGLAPNITRWKNIIQNADTHLYCIFSQPPILVADEILNKISQNLDFRLLFGQNSILSSDNEFITKLNLTKSRPKKNFHLGITPIVGVNLVLSDNMVSLMFPYENVTDMHSSFVSSDKSFHKWCLDFFNYKWSLSDLTSNIDVSVK